MNLDTWLAYVATAGIVIIWPGPSVLLSAAHGMAYGLPRTFGTIAGDLSANALQIIAVSLGIGAVVMKSPGVFMGLKWFGATYLLFLGVKQFIATSMRLHVENQTQTKSVYSLYRHGFMVSALNPKAILFFLAIFPQFLQPSGSPTTQFVILGTTILLMDGIALTFYARFAQRMKTWLASHPKSVWLNRITGSILILAALLLLS